MRSLSSVICTLSIFSKTVARDLLRFPARAVLTVAGIALGVAVFLSISLANDSALSRFRQTVDEIAGKANIEIKTATGRYFDDSVLEDLRWLWLADSRFSPMLRADVVVPSAPRVTRGQSLNSSRDKATAEAPAVATVKTRTDKASSQSNSISYSIPGSANPNPNPNPSANANATSTSTSSVASKKSVSKDKSGDVVQLIGMDIFAAKDFGWYQSSDVEIDSTESKPASPSFGRVLAGRRLAEDLGIAPGDSLEILSNDKAITISIGGLLAEDGLGKAYSGRLLVCDIGLAQELLGLEGSLSQISVIAPEERTEEIVALLSERLPQGLIAERSNQRNAKVEKMTRSFEYNLLALAMIALLVAMFMIYNTMTMAVIRRRPLIGTLRALGLSRFEVFTMIMLEAALLGLIGSTLGTFAGIALADGSLRAVAETYQRLYFRIPLDSIYPEPVTCLQALALGLAITLIAAMPPALEATMVSPVESTRSHTSDQRVSRLVCPLFFTGLLLFILAVFLSRLPAVDNLPLWGYASALACVAGTAFILPLSIKLVLDSRSAFAYVITKLFGLEGRISLASLSGSLGRVSIAVASLSLGIAMMVSLAIMIGSFRQTVTVWIDQTFIADLWMQPSARAGGSRESTFSPEMEEKVASIPGVRVVEPWIEIPVEYDTAMVTLAGARIDLMSRFGAVSFLSGRDCSMVGSTMDPMSILISESLSIKHGLSRGDIISLPGTERNTLSDSRFKIEDIYYDYASDSGIIVMPMETFKRFTGLERYSSLAITLEPNADLEAVRKIIISELGDISRFNIKSTGELRSAVLDIFDRTFAITYALHTIAMIVAILSVINALFAIVLDSRKEFAVLEYLGLVSSRLKKIILIDAGLIGFFGSVSGFALGFLLAFLLINVINKQSFGWTVRFELPLIFLTQSFFLIMLTSVLAGLVPLRAAQGSSAVEAIRQE